MRIAQIAPLIERVPPRAYGGTERVVHSLTEELVRHGHDVTLFASGDSQTSGTLVPCSGQSLRASVDVEDHVPHHMVMIDRVRRRADDFDILHFHIEYFHFPLFRDRASRTLTTLHGRLDLPDLRPVFAAFPEMPLVSISNHQRRPVPPVNWQGTVYHGLAPDELSFTRWPRGDYLAFLGRISPEKGADRAIRIADAAGVPLEIAAKVDKADRVFFERTIKPMLASPHVTFIGEIGAEEKAGFLGNARALLFPINWPEPFGLVLIEAMACGTPVIAFPCGSVPEIIEDGVTGFLVETVEEAAAAVEKVGKLDRARIRREFEARFSVHRMAQDYLAIYESLLSSGDGRKRVAA